ncbi:dGTP triphosphohydrolase [Microbacterium sp.]|uniref:deoxyguanosinetriphosphate triphosphohydrolase family protein n=1 Tax=Microbacterium sp. TaxID=51671 RepID=UPI0031FECA9F|nr:dNTP triphosphohydrolase [Microbacterium sp.]
MPRDDRRHDDKPEGGRSPAQRDYDRLLYSSAFRRLNGVTQVVLPRGEPHLFHNRLVHSLKVAQIGRRMAEGLVDAYPAEELAGLRGGGIDPDVVEAACLAHDLGHPPFGHVAEKELHGCVVDAGDHDGFEGNAQTLRIVTGLSAVTEAFPGLNLTRATLAATAKYPWFRDDAPIAEKWGAYRVDQAEFDFAHEGLGHWERPIEADIMDRSDDIAYAVHDLEDFYRAGLIPLDRIVTGVEDLSPVFARVQDKWPSHIDPVVPDDAELQGVADTLASFPLDVPFRGTKSQRAQLRSFTSSLVNELAEGTSLVGGDLVTERGPLVLTELAKKLTWHYVIASSPLGTQQVGHRAIIRQLFGIYTEALEKREVHWLPTRWEEEAAAACDADPEGRPRFVADVIAGLTEEEAVRHCHRLTGVAPAAFLDPVVV